MIDLNNPDLLSLCDQAMRFQFPIFGIKNGHYEQQGTCTLVAIDDHLFIVTAAHVTNLRHESEDHSIHIYNHESNEFIRITEEIYGFDAKHEIPNHFDVSIIKIDHKDYSNIPSESFVRPSRLLLPRQQLNEHIFLATGYPSSKNKSFPKFKNRTKCLALLTKRKKETLAKENTGLTINLTYDAPNSPTPNGMSGGAIWVLTKELPCNPTLAGILVAHNSKNNHIIAVKIDFVIEMIKSHTPGTVLDAVNSDFFITDDGENGSKIHFPNIME